MEVGLLKWKCSQALPDPPCARAKFQLQSTIKFQVEENTFELTHYLGSGAFSSVYQCTVSNEDGGTQQIALKLVKADNGGIDIQKYVQREYENLLRCQSATYLVHLTHRLFLIEFGDYDLRHAFPLELCQRIPVPMPESEVLILTHDILHGLTFLQENGMMHRDIKPSNILQRPSGEYCLADLGLGRALACLEKKTQFAGTMRYMAPEIINGSDEYSEAVDLWSLGLMIVDLLLGYNWCERNSIILSSQSKEKWREVACLVDHPFFHFLLRNLLVEHMERMNAITALEKTLDFIDWMTNSVSNNSPVQNDAPAVVDLVPATTPATDTAPPIASAVVSVVDSVIDTDTSSPATTGATAPVATAATAVTDAAAAAHPRPDSVSSVLEIPHSHEPVLRRVRTKIAPFDFGKANAYLAEMESKLTESNRKTYLNYIEETDQIESKTLPSQTVQIPRTKLTPFALPK